MILLFLLFNLFAADLNHPFYVSKDLHQLTYKVTRGEISAYCEKSPNTENWFGGIQLKNKKKQALIFRSPVDHDKCNDFMKAYNQISKENPTLLIMGYGQSSEINKVDQIYFGAIKGKGLCWDWFKGDCGTLPSF